MSAVATFLYFCDCPSHHAAGFVNRLQSLCFQGFTRLRICCASRIQVFAFFSAASQLCKALTAGHVAIDVIVLFEKWKALRTDPILCPASSHLTHLVIIRPIQSVPVSRCPSPGHRGRLFRKAGIVSFGSFSCPYPCHDTQEKSPSHSEPCPIKAPISLSKVCLKMSRVNILVLY
jgi:hypothetical protein